MKRKFFSILTALALCLSLCPTWAFAADSGTCGNNLTWTLDGGVLTISGTGAMGTYGATPSEHSPWYEQRGSIQSVVIEGGVTYIGKYAFYNCENLTSVKILNGDNDQNIGQYVFRNCTKLTRVDIPASVKSIGAYAFSNASNAEIYYAGTLAQWNSISGSGNCGASKDKLVINPHEVTITGGGADATGAGTYSEGATVEVSAGTKDGQLFAGWTASVELENFNAAQAETSFTMPANDVTLTANWAEAVAKVTANGGDTYYATIKDAWDKACAASSATITLLGNVESSEVLFMGRDDTINLEGNGHIIISDSSNAVYIDEGGTFTVTDCTISTTHENGKGLYINDGTVTVNNCTISGKYVGLWWQGDGSVTLNGGTFTSENDDAIRIWNNTPIPISTLLGEVDGKPCAYYDSNGKPVPLTEDQTSLPAGTYTVKECKHEGDLTPTDNGNGTHTLKCPYCGDEKTEAHTIGYTAEAAGRVITVKEGCTICGYGDTLGTVTFTIPKLVYGDLSGVISADISGRLLEKMKVTLQLDEHHILWLDAQYGNTLSDLAENTVLDAGEHTLRVAFILKETDQESVSCGLTFTVDPKPPVDPDPGPDEPDPPVDPGQVETRMEVEEGISQVPEGLKNIPALDSAAKLEAAMRTAVTQTGVPAQNTAVYDVKLMVSTNGGQTWVPATEANFPAAGLTIALPYPAGTDSSYTFTVVHMFTTAAFGRTPGNTESPAVTNTEAGLRFTVTGLSPISVGWKEKEPDRPVTPGRPSGGGGGGSGVSTYRVTVERTVHGKVASNRTYAPEDSTVTLTVTPDSGCVLDALTVTDSRGNAVKLTDKGDGRYTFSMPGRAVTVKASFKAVRTEWSSPYSDVAAGAWYYDAARYATENGLMKGVGGGHFAPNDTLTRAQLVQILYNRAGRPAVQTGSRFSDVGPGAWYADAIAWAASEKIVSGVGGGRFAPNDPITREQLATTLWRYAGRPAAGGTLSFPDADQAAGYALDALRWAVENGVINGKSGGILDPKGLATRAQTAQMLMNLLKDD